MSNSWNRGSEGLHQKPVGPSGSGGLYGPPIIPSTLFFAPSAVECLTTVPASILAQMNCLPKRSGPQIRAFRGTAYIAPVRRKVQELFHQSGELFSGPASDARRRRLRKWRLIWTALLPVNSLFRLFCSSVPGTRTASILAQMNLPAENIRPANSSVSGNRLQGSGRGRLKLPNRSKPAAGLPLNSEEFVSEVAAYMDRLSRRQHPFLRRLQLNGEPSGLQCLQRKRSRLPNMSGSQIRAIWRTDLRGPKAPFLPGPASETRRPRQRRWRCTPAPRMRQPPISAFHHKTAEKSREPVRPWRRQIETGQWIRGLLPQYWAER